ncbi:Mitochondrial inner membrane i-AAA protease supercomplex subunit YME1 [Trametes pubescens]|uniref:Mitochondrial inner membrane i-AAA protease supercomplex subunit YME1 n=1 Tax=Trametes pubescens TaxID=154538 RepID=A0A1M2VEW0_TRAPU|nr:Mitochondrial inner membrane i-AAA protease supercomplex subunit YME1 [Trametes pubescens]
MSMSAFLRLGTCCAQARPLRSPALHLPPFRSLSTLPRTAPTLRAWSLPQRHPAIVHSRALSLASLFRKPGPLPSPAVVATISKLEAEADAHPNDVEKQVALFEALVSTKAKPGLDTVVARWERLCEFHPSHPLIRSDTAFKLYLVALRELGLDASINPAVRRRDALLAASSTSAAASILEQTPEITSTPSDSLAATTSAAQVSSSVTSESAPSTSSPPPTSSQQAAQEVLSGATVTARSVHTDYDALRNALGRGSGVPGNPIVVTVAAAKGEIFLRLMRYAIFSILTVFFVLVFLSLWVENSGMLKAGPRQAEFEPIQAKTYKFSDVHGVDEAKGELQDIVEFLKDPSAFGTLGGKLPKGVLLTGPPGTGKTMLARAVAGEAGVPFLFASGSEFDEMFVGVGAKRVRELFAAARKKQPAIIFIDELDAIGGKRSSRDQHYMKQTLNQLLVEMDGFLQNEGIIVIAATNFPETLDPALVRPGRFDKHVAVPLPDVRGRVQILQHHMTNVTTAPEVDTMVLARGTVGFSGADLQNLVNQAAVKAARDGAKAVDFKHFEWAKDRIIMGAERKTSFISEEIKKMTAYHEGGHALVALYTEGAMPLHKVTCVPRGHALGITSQLPKDDRYSVSLKEYLAEIDVCMGGRVAEELVYGPENVTSGASSDLQHATRTARAMVKNWGYSHKIGPVYLSDREDTISPKKKDEIEDEVRSLLIAGESRVTALLKSKADELHRLADALVEHETLDAEEVQKVIKGERIRAIDEVIKEDLSRLQHEGVAPPPPRPPVLVSDP